MIRRPSPFNPNPDDGSEARDDEILADLIASATHRCDTELDDHIKRFKKNRAKNPRYKPGGCAAVPAGLGP